MLPGRLPARPLWPQFKLYKLQIQPQIPQRLSHRVNQAPRHEIKFQWGRVTMPAHFRISLPHTSRTFNRVSFSNCQSSYLTTFQLWRRRIIWYSPSTILLFGSPRNRNQPPPLPTSSSGRRHLPPT